MVVSQMYCAAYDYLLRSMYGCASSLYPAIHGREEKERMGGVYKGNKLKGSRGSLTGTQGVPEWFSNVEMYK